MVLLPLLLLLFRLSDASNRKIYPMGDIQFQLPECSLESRNVTLENLFASLEIRSNLLDHSLEFFLSLQTNQRICRLCQTDPSQCNFTTDNHTLSLSLDTSYNFKVILLDRKRESITQTQAYSLQGGGSQIELEKPCGEILTLVLLSIVNIKSPISRDFLLVAYDHSHPGEILPCQSPWSTNRTDLSCSISQTYHYVEYPFTNCLSPLLESPPPQIPRESLSPQEYYRRRLEEEEGEEKWRNQVLCGETWFSLLERSRLDLYCDQELILYIKPKAWYEAAVIAITAWRNGQTNRTNLWLLLYSLESTCPQRESEVALEDTIFFDMITGLERVNESDREREELCLEPVERGNVTLPYYARHYGSWFYRLFHYGIEPKEGMKSKAIFLILLYCFLIVISLIATVLVIYQIYFRKKSSKTEYQLLY